MSNNSVSIGNCVLELQSQYYVYNPYNLFKNLPFGSKSLFSVNKTLSAKLLSLYKAILSKNLTETKILSCSILSFLDKEYKYSLEQSIKKIGKDSYNIALDFFYSWKLRWILYYLINYCTCLLEDLYYAEDRGFSLTEEDKEKQFLLREEIFDLWDITTDNMGEFTDSLGIDLSIYYPS